jgi:hypothetical protein
MSFENEEKLKKIMEKNRAQRDEQFRANLSQMTAANASLTENKE